MGRRRATGEGTVYRRASDGRWVGALDLGRDPTGRRTRHVVYGARRRDVLAQLAQARARLADDAPVRDARTTVAALVGDWTVRTLPASRRRASTRENYATIARTHLVPAPFGALTLDRLRPSDVEALLTCKREQGLSPSTVRTIYTVCRAVLDVAVRDGLVRRNAAAAVRRPSLSRVEARFLSPADVGRLLAAARGQRPAYPLMVLLLGTGLRRGEALGLHWRDVDTEARVARVRCTLARVGGALTFADPKTTRAARVVPLPGPVVGALVQHRAEQAAERRAASGWAPWPGHEDLVFTTAHGTPVDPRNAARGFARIASSAGLDGVSLHTLRHTAAAALIGSGAHLKVVQELLGHASFAVTADVYAHAAAEARREAADRLGAAFPW